MYYHSKHVEQKTKQVTSVGLYLFNYQDDARSNKQKIKERNFSCRCQVRLETVSQILYHRVLLTVSDTSPYFRKRD